MITFKKFYIFILIFIVISNLSCNYFNSRNVTAGITPASAKQIDKQKDLINSLADASTKEEREKILKDNSTMINSDFVLILLTESHNLYNGDRNSPDYKKSHHLGDIALESAEFTGNETVIAKALFYYSIFDESDDTKFPSIEKALVLFKASGDRKGEILCYYKEAMYLFRHFPEEKEKAFNSVEKGLNILKTFQDSLLEGYGYNIKANFHDELGQKEKAIENYKKSIELYKTEGNIFKVLDTYHYMHGLYFRAGMFNEAEECLRKQKDFIEKLSSQDVRHERDEDRGYFIDTFFAFAPDDKNSWTEFNYTALGNLYTQTGKYEEAIKTYKKIVELNPASTRLSETYSRLASIYSLLGQKDRALKYYLEAVDNSTEGFDICRNYQQTGLFYLRDMKNPDEALKYFELALKKAEELPRWNESYKNVTFQYISEVYAGKGDFDRAIKTIEELMKPEDKTGYYYRLLGELYMKKGDNIKALEFVNKAIETDKEQTYSASYLILDYNTQGDIYVKEENFSEAVKAYREGIKLGEEIHSSSLWKYYFSLGNVYKSQGNQVEAFNAYNRSINLIETMRQEFKLEELKRDFMQDKLKVYEEMIDLLINMKKDRKAFEYNEKARARAFLDILANQKVDVHKGVKPELAAKEDELKTMIQYLSADISEEKEKPLMAQRTLYIREGDKNLKSLKLEYEQVMEEIKMENPEYMTFISVNPFPLEEIQTWLDKDTVIMEYFVGEKRSFLWITGKDTFNTVVIDCPGKDIEKLVREYRSLACDDITLQKLKSNKWKDLSGKLYDILFKDGEKYISKKTRIIISLHRILHYMPFQVLIDSKGKMLVEKYEITSIPSSSILKYCHDKNTLKKDRLLAFEIGDFKAGNLHPLPSTKEEVRAISGYFNKKEIYSGSGMKADILYEKGRDFDILHFATHGSLDPSSPLFSSLVFSDRTLPVYEIFNLDLKAYLVCLSACKTGLGEEASGDELVGLARAFIYAGTPTICASLWDVSDVSTSELMERFYYHLRKNNKAEALRLAQMDIMKKYPHPFFWAPFVLTGDWR